MSPLPSLGWLGWVLPSFWLFFCFKVWVMDPVLVHDYESCQKIIWMRFKKFQIMVWRVRIYSWLKTLKRHATQRVDTFLEPSSIVRILLTRSCEVPNLSSIWRVGSRRSSITISRTRTMFSSVGAVEAFRTLTSSSTPSLRCLNLLNQHLPVAHDREPSPDVSYISSWINHGVIPFNCAHLKTVRYSIFSIFPETQNM